MNLIIQILGKAIYFTQKPAMSKSLGKNLKRIVQRIYITLVHHSSVISSSKKYG